METAFYGSLMHSKGKQPVRIVSQNKTGHPPIPENKIIIWKINSVLINGKNK